MSAAIKVQISLCPTPEKAQLVQPKSNIPQVIIKEI